MSTTYENNPQRIDELMVDAATQGLSPQDQAELSAAIERDPSLRLEAEAYELAVAAVDEALTRPGRGESLPASLREKLIQAAPTLGGPEHLRLAGTQSEKASTKQAAGFSWNDGRAFGWYAAAAALIAVAVLLIQAPEKEIVERLVEVPVPVEPVEAPPIGEQYAALAQDADTLTASWGIADGGDARFANATGEVIWNPDQQAGYMKLAGLPINDPSVEQYQLWIVDGSRDPAVENTNRIDGGVFDVTAEGEVIVPIDAKLIARNAAAFAITVETPGGVVESKGPLQLLAVPNAAG